ncbi:uncharacterized protein [Amphiura filiformis]|uniref:uncharacterized protein n=1 Tax=Amphiura filiformis TaxID=82378 RepID=UPI003B21F2AB
MSLSHGYQQNLPQCRCCHQRYLHALYPSFHAPPACDQPKPQQLVNAETQTGIPNPVTSQFTHDDFMKANSEARKMLLAEAEDEMKLYRLVSFKETTKVQVVLDNVLNRFPTVRNSPKTRKGLKKSLIRNISARKKYQEKGKKTAKVLLQSPVTTESIGHNSEEETNSFSDDGALPDDMSDNEPLPSDSNETNDGEPFPTSPTSSRSESDTSSDDEIDENVSLAVIKKTQQLLHPKKTPKRKNASATKTPKKAKTTQQTQEETEEAPNQEETETSAESSGTKNNQLIQATSLHQEDTSHQHETGPTDAERRGTDNRQMWETTSALKVKFTLGDFVAIGISDKKYDIGQVESVQKVKGNVKVTITYFKKSGEKLYRWMLSDGKPYQEPIHANSIVFKLLGNAVLAAEQQHIKKLLKQIFI